MLTALKPARPEWKKGEKIWQFCEATVSHKKAAAVLRQPYCFRDFFFTQLISQTRKVKFLWHNTRQNTPIDWNMTVIVLVNWVCFTDSRQLFCFFYYFREQKAFPRNVKKSNSMVAKKGLKSKTILNVVKCKEVDSTTLSVWTEGRQDNAAAAALKISDLFTFQRNPPMMVSDLFEDIKDGIMLIALLEVLSGQKLVRSSFLLNLWDGCTTFQGYDLLVCFYIWVLLKTNKKAK